MMPADDARIQSPGVYADLVTVAGFKPVVAAEKSPGGFDSLPLPLFLLSNVERPGKYVAQFGWQSRVSGPSQK